MKENIKIVTAGAGSGKTYRLATEVLEAIQQKKARPEGILLTTFTRKAAAELEERVRVRLLEKGAWEEAQRIRQAWIGTIDSVCLRIIQEYAFEAGQSPEIAVFGPGEDVNEFNRALTDSVTDAELEQLDGLSECLSINDFYEKNRDWRSIVKDIADATRANRVDAAKLDGFAQKSVEGYLRLLSKPPASAKSLDKGLIDQLNTASSLLEKNVNSGLDTTKITRESLQTIRQLRGRFIPNNNLPWAEWARLSKLAVGAKSSAAVTGLNEAAARHCEHPRLHEDIRAFTELVYRIAKASLGCYQERKRVAGLLDFIDLEELCLTLLNDATVGSSLKERLDLVLVDEFQDTSPIQLELFLKLATLAKASVWVGDQKQSIFEFRGADPMLMQSVLDAIKSSDRLPRSFRSRPRLVQLTNEAFAPVFPNQGIEDIKLEPERGDVLKTVPCESWVLRTKNIHADTQAIARRIGEILARPEDYPVIDRRSGDKRPIVPGDLCVLARNNDICVKLADSIGACGLAVELARPGLIRRPEVLLALAGLRLLLNPTDSMAAAQLTFLHNATDVQLESWLIPRLEEVAQYESARQVGRHIDGYMNWGNDATLTEVLDHRRDYGSLSPLEILHQAMELTRVRDRCVDWGEPSQRLANLEKLASLTDEYQDLVQARGEASSIAGLLTYLYRTARDRQDEQAMGGANAVRVSTYHRAKGLEWHMVILYQLNEEPKNWLFEPTVESNVKFSFERPLEGRWIRYWPWPYANHKKGVFLGEAVEATPEYAMAQSRAENEEIRLLYVGMTRARDYLVFAARQGGHKWLDQLRDKKNVRTFVLPQDETVNIQGFRVLDLENTEPLISADQTVSWFAGVASRTDRNAKTIYCSNLILPDNSLNLVEASPEKITARVPITGSPDMTNLGNAVHAFLSCDSSSLSPQKRGEIAKELLEAHGVSAAIRPQDLLVIFDRFFDYIRNRWPDAKIRREWPLSCKIGKFELHGSADLLLETGDGCVVIDYKTFPGGESELVEKAKSFAGQLTAYRRGLEKAKKKPVIGTWIHYPISGYLVEVRMNGSAEEFLERCISIR
ncbi:MAG: UvrD-helicase domain-containing protein [Deltaproteobacteria bacterium]|nr:UvrD-helicase domain-containing protein [Deltaproteobacteria bacterium]